MRPYVLVALKPIPDLAIQPADLIVLDPRAPRPVVLQHALEPDYARLLAEIELGRLAPANPLRPVSELAHAVGVQLRPRQPAPRRAGPRPLWLRRLK